MKKLLKRFPVLVLLSIVFIMLTAAISVSGATNVPAQGSRFTGVVTVPQWEVGHKWGYKVPYYYYSTDYCGVGFEVVDIATINGYECYDVKIWWDVLYDSEDSGYYMKMDGAGWSYRYRFEGHAYLTTKKLAITRYTVELQMEMKYDGSKLLDNYNTRGIDIPGWNVDDWRYVVDYSFMMTYDYNPPFVMYDYPLEVGKTWNSSSTVNVAWEYSTFVYMNDEMKNDLESWGGSSSGFDDVEEQGSESTDFSLTGSFEVIEEDTVTTDIGEHDVFVIEYNIGLDYTRATRAEPQTSYGDLSVPGGDATLGLVGGTSGTGTSYFDPEEGHPEQVDTGGYLSESYTTVEPESIENSYNTLPKSSKSGGDKDEGVNVLLIIAAVVGVVILIVFILLIFLIPKMKTKDSTPPPGTYQYPPQQPQQPPQQPPQQQQSPPQPQPQPQPPTPIQPPEPELPAPPQ